MKTKSKFKQIPIEDIALQFIKHNDNPSKNNVICSNKTLVDNRFFVKKYINTKNSECSLSQSFERLVPIDNENKENIPINWNNSKMKIIQFYKVPPKDLGDDEDCPFHSDTNDTISDITSQKTKNLISNGEVKLREIKQIKYNKKLYFNLNYQNIYDSITEIYFPLLQNLETISSLKSMTNNTLSCIEFFCSHDSIFELLPIKNNTKTNNPNNSFSNNLIMVEFFDQLKIFENIELSLILFIMHIILEARIEYMDNINEDDILSIYHDSYSVIQKLYEIIILMILFNDNYNNSNKKNGDESNDNKKNKNSNTTISFESLCLKYVKDYFKFLQKPNNNEQIINRINENIFSVNNILFNSCSTLFNDLIIFRNDSGNLDSPDKEEALFLHKHNNYNTSNTSTLNNQKEKIFLSKEFFDQYTCYKTMYIFFTKENNQTLNNTKEIYKKENKIEKEKEKNNVKENNNETIAQMDSDVILRKLTSMSSSYKELSNCFLLYYTNFKILIEKNKVKPPFLPPLDSKKYTYTLVLDLDETLVHYIEEESRAYVQVRPYADYFLNEMSKYFELVIFTAAAEDYADIVLNELDKNKVINYKLYRKHTEQINGVFIKDLSKLGRDLSKILIVDNNKDNFSLQPENGLHICSFIGDQNDDELYSLSGDLMKIIDSKKKDIRPVVKEISMIMKKRYESKDVFIE
jgi:Dullard-like phosphatase family protein